MPVTDDQEATLHAQLAGRFEEYQRRLDALDPAEVEEEYNALVSAAFAVAVEERLPGATAADVIEFVGGVRSRNEGADRIDPLVAESLILAITSDGNVEDTDPWVGFQTQLILLAALVAEAGFDEAGLDGFLRRSRTLADKWLA
jgi:hypothetical protein